MDKKINIVVREEFDLDNPDTFTAIPNDLVDKYMKIFKEEQLEAAVDLIRQSYRAGLEIGRAEAYRKMYDR